MASRVAPVNQRQNGKASKKIKELSDIRAESPDAISSCDADTSSTSTNEIVGLSLTPILRERLEKSLSSVPDVDSRRVAEIKTAIKNGTFQICAEDIADAMIGFEQSLGD